MAQCKSCPQRIVWVKTEPKDGKPARSMPLDAGDDGKAKVVDDGNIVLVATLPDGTPVARYVGKGKGAHVSHFATCENAKDHRKSGR